MTAGSLWFLENFAAPTSPAPRCASVSAAAVGRAGRGSALGERSIPLGRGVFVARSERSAGRGWGGMYKTLSRKVSKHHWAKGFDGQVPDVNHH